jgi:hypothetical protein
LLQYLLNVKEMGCQLVGLIIFTSLGLFMTKHNLIWNMAQIVLQRGRLPKEHFFSNIQANNRLFGWREVTSVGSEAMVSRGRIENDKKRPDKICVVAGVDHRDVAVFVEQRPVVHI